MALQTETWVMNSSLYGHAEFRVVYDDVTMRVESLGALNNSTNANATVKLYHFSAPTTVAYTRSFPPASNQTYTMKANENYLINEWSLSCGFVPL